MMLRLRELTEEERKTIERLVHARNTPVGKLKRAQIIWLASQGRQTPEIAKQLGLLGSSEQCTTLSAQLAW
jgi:hypothetical protein